MCAKRTIKKFDPVKVVLPLKFMSFGCTMVTIRSKTLLYMSKPQRGELDDRTMDEFIRYAGTAEGKLTGK